MAGSSCSLMTFSVCCRRIFSIFTVTKAAVSQGLLQCGAGIIGVNMDLDDLIVVHQNQTVAQLLEEGSQLLRVLVLSPGRR